MEISDAAEVADFDAEAAEAAEETADDIAAHPAD